MKNDYSKEAFLLKIFKEELNHSQNIIKYSKKPNGKNLRIEEAVRRYLAIQERLNEVALSSDNKMKYLKMLYHEKYCAKKENIHSQNIKNLDEKLQIQRDSLDAWIDYLVEASYPLVNGVVIAINSTNEIRIYISNELATKLNIQPGDSYLCTYMITTLQ